MDYMEVCLLVTAADGVVWPVVAGGARDFLLPVNTVDCRGFVNVDIVSGAGGILGEKLLIF